MLQPPKSTSPLIFPSSPAGSNFTPRKEFVQQPSRQSSFALLAFSSNNVIRLSNFPQPLVTSLRSLLDSIIGLNSFRENSEHKLCEIVLTGKPWSNPKSLSTEIVIVQVFGTLIAQGYSFLSQLDYGREHNDRVSLAFSRPVPSPNPDPLSSTQPKQSFLVPFALSFPSATILRVVCSPLHASPAILQSVRGAWPRGVTAEKKLGEGCWEFKLKGYSWFSEDTFPEDALAHILTLLTALDKHAWTLVTSISLTSAHSRTKDLWIFSGPAASSSSASDDSSPNSIGRTSPINLGTPLSPSKHEAIMDHVHEGSGDSEGSGGSGNADATREKTQHMRSVTTDSPTSLGRSSSKRLSKLPREHGRAASNPSDGPPAVLRKKTPLKHESDEPILGDDQQPQPQPQSQPIDHDIIPGPPPPLQVIYSTPRRDSPPPAGLRAPTETIHVSDLPQQHFPSNDPSRDDAPQTPLGPSPSHPLVSLPEAAERHQADEDFSEAPAQHHANTSAATLQQPVKTPQSDVHTPPLPTPPLLGSTVFRTPEDEFRDSAFSDATFDVPIKWIPGRDGQQMGPQERPPPSAFLAPHNSSADDRSSITTGPLLPGGWAPTPATEIADPITSTSTDVNANTMPERQNTVEPRSPEIVSPELPSDDVEGGVDMARRKSEAGVLGKVPSPVREDEPPVPPVQANGDASAEEEHKPKEGWVLVSVAAESSAAAPAPEPAQEAPNVKSADFAGPKPSPGATQVPLSAAQLIAAADAAPPSSPSPAPEKDKDKDKEGGKDKGKEKSSSALGRLFSRSRRKLSESGVQKVKSADQDPPGGDVRSKKKGGGAMPTIRSGKRRSIE